MSGRLARAPQVPSPPLGCVPALPRGHTQRPEAQLTACLLGHGHEVVVGHVPQVLGGLAQCQCIGRDGGCVGTQEPSTCFRPQK